MKISNNESFYANILCEITTLQLMAHQSDLLLSFEDSKYDID